MPLLRLFVVTTAVKLPAVVGRVDRVTVSEVAVAAVTVPAAPPLNTTVLRLAIGSKPRPLIVSVAALAARLMLLLLTTGDKAATCTAVPLARLLVVTTAVTNPAVFGLTEKVTMSEVFVAEVTVPTAPLLKATRLLAAVVANPKPLIVSVFALAATRALLLVTTGVTLATWTGAELLTPPVLTTAVKLPAVAGVVLNVTVIDVAVADVTSPIAPLFKVTALLPGVVSKPKPLITSVAPFAAMLAVLLITTGMTVATLTAAPLLRLLVVTTAVRLPEDVGVVDSVMVNDVDVAAVTVPTAPLLKTTVLFAAIGLKPTPLIVSEVALAARTVLVAVTTGTMEATCTAVPLLTLFEVTMAVRFPADVGAVVKVTLSVVAVAEETVPTAPLLKVTELFAAVVSKPVPLIVNEVTPARSTLELFASTTGTTSAT